MQWRKSTKMLFEIHLWACHCPKGAVLTRDAQCRNETTEFIKMSGISSLYSPHSVTYFSFVLLKNEVFCPHMNLSGEKRRGLNQRSKANKKIRGQMQMHLVTWICLIRGSQSQIQGGRGDSVGRDIGCPPVHNLQGMPVLIGHFAQSWCQGGRPNTTSQWAWSLSYGPPHQKAFLHILSPMSSEKIFSWQILLLHPWEKVVVLWPGFPFLFPVQD